MGQVGRQTANIRRPVKIFLGPGQKGKLLRHCVCIFEGYVLFMCVIKMSGNTLRLNKNCMFPILY